MPEGLVLSVVIPAYRVSDLISETLHSVFSPIPGDWNVEVLVVDDGSPDGDELEETLSGFQHIRLIRHHGNRGMCAARNTGIRASRGDLVTILDADDRLVPEWPSALAAIVSEWPEEVHVCFAACQNPEGRITASEPAYTGPLTFDDLLNERRSGEYLPIFRGPYIRERQYVDLSMRKSCGIVSYLRLAEDGPFWVTSKLMRVYYDRRAGSVSSAWTRPEKARETARCYEALFARYESQYRERAPHLYRSKLLRFAVYKSLAGESGAWRLWLHAAHWSRLAESIFSALVLLLGPRFCAWGTGLARHLGVIRQYG
ncbi:MAG: glycosyltransferase family 2 protein [Candidatus Sericytochromatia bacterium]|nr:glycosyltransferase family 2 protein [Candidatus Tanganyikabacteria bacterium]